MALARVTSLTVTHSYRQGLVISVHSSLY